MLRNHHCCRWIQASWYRRFVRIKSELCWNCGALDVILFRGKVEDTSNAGKSRDTSRCRRWPGTTSTRTTTRRATTNVQHTGIGTNDSDFIGSETTNIVAWIGWNCKNYLLTQHLHCHLRMIDYLICCSNGGLFVHYQSVPCDYMLDELVVWK